MLGNQRLRVLPIWELEFGNLAQGTRPIASTLQLDGYARIDFRLSAEGVPYFLEANPNPEIAQSQEFAQAAEHDGLSYTVLLHRILDLAIKRQAAKDA